MGTFIDIETLVSQLKPKELRKLIMSYIEVVNKLPEDIPKKRIDVGIIVKSLNSEQDITFFKDFFISLGQTCKTAEKGIKVGHVFITQTQVKVIRLKGIVTKEDIEIQNDDAAVEEVKVDEGHKPNVDVDIQDDVLCQFSTPDLRKYLLSFMKLIDKAITIEE